MTLQIKYMDNVVRIKTDSLLYYNMLFIPLKNPCYICGGKIEMLDKPICTNNNMNGWIHFDCLDKELKSEFEKDVIMYLLEL